MKFDEIKPDQIPVAININSASGLEAIARRAFRNIPERLWKFTTPRTEVMSFTMEEPTPENLQKILDHVNDNVSKAFLKAVEEAAKKYKNETK